MTVSSMGAVTHAPGKLMCKLPCERISILSLQQINGELVYRCQDCASGIMMGMLHHQYRCSLLNTLWHLRTAAASSPAPGTCATFVIMIVSFDYPNYYKSYAQEAEQAYQNYPNYYKSYAQEAEQAFLPFCNESCLQHCNRDGSGNTSLWHAT